MLRSLLAGFAAALLLVASVVALSHTHDDLGSALDSASPECAVCVGPFVSGHALPGNAVAAPPAAPPSLPASVRAYARPLTERFVLPLLARGPPAAS
jgi:hypothetical protein